MSSPTIDSVRLRRWRSGALVAYAIGGVLAATWGPRLPALRADLHVGTAEIGAVLTGSTIGLLVGLTASSAVARMLGIRRAVGVAFAVITVAMAAAAGGVAIGSPIVVVVALLVLGVGTGVLDVVVNVDGSVIEQLTGRSFLPLLHALWLVGAAVGAGIGAACAAVGVPPAGQFIGEAGIVALAGVLVVLALPSGRRGEVEEEAESLPLGARFRRWARGWTERRLLLLGLLVFGVELAEGSARTWLPSAVQSGSHQSPATAALFVTLFSVGTAGFRAVGGPVVDRVGRVLVVRVTIAIGIVGLILFILGGSIGVVLVGTFLWSIGNCLAGPLGMSAAAEGGPGAAARVSVVSSIGFFAGLAGPPLIGFLAQQVGLVASFWLLVAFLVVALLTTSALRR